MYKTSANRQIIAKMHNTKVVTKALELPAGDDSE